MYIIIVIVWDEFNCEYMVIVIFEVFNCGGCGFELVDLEFEGFVCVDFVLVFLFIKFLINDLFLEIIWMVDGQIFENLSVLEYVFLVFGNYIVIFQVISLQGCFYIG